MNLLDSVRLMARHYPGGTDALAVRLAKSPEVLRKELAGAKGFKLGADDAAEISAMCAEARTEHALGFITAWAQRSGCFVIPIPPMDGSPVNSEAVHKMADMARESAELLAETSRSLADGRVSDNELERVKREAMHLVASVQGLLSAMAGLNELCKPRGEA